jgi:hypothetical protein
MIQTEAELRALIGHPGSIAKAKQIAALDVHCRAFIAESPLLMLATANANGLCDVSPRGDLPGFVAVEDHHHLIIPERPGNRRADSLVNITENPQVGLLFLIPGNLETLRVNGLARLVQDPEVLEPLAVQGKVPKLAIRVEVREAFLHCGKALVRSKAWEARTPQPSNRASAAKVFVEHSCTAELSEAQAEKILEEDYREGLY